MSANVAADGKSANRAGKSSFLRKALIILSALLVAFLLGFVPMWWAGREKSSQLTMAHSELKRAVLEKKIAASALDARRGEYELARQSASDFFTTLREESDAAANSPFSAIQKENLKPLFARRDEVITLLARSDPAAADRLLEVYLSLRQSLGSS